MEASAARLELDQKFDLPLRPRTEPQCFLPNPAQCHDPSKSKREKRRTMDAPPPQQKSTCAQVRSYKGGAPRQLGLRGARGSSLDLWSHNEAAFLHRHRPELAQDCRPPTKWRCRVAGRVLRLTKSFAGDGFRKIGVRLARPAARLIQLVHPLRRQTKRLTIFKNFPFPLTLHAQVFV